MTEMISVAIARRFAIAKDCKRNPAKEHLDNNLGE
jgi:hypothetical protein